MKATLAFLLFGLLWAVYALSYGGAYTADDEHLFASGAISLAQGNPWEVPQMYGNTRILGEYHDVEPGQVLLGALLVRWADANGLGRVQALFLQNILVTALTACVVYATLLALDYSILVAGLGGLLYGLTTLAWPYATTYYRDPLAALGLAIAYLGFEECLARERTPHRRWLGAGICLVGLCGGLLAKSTAAIGLIVFPIVALARLPRAGWTRRTLGSGLIAAAVLVGALAVISISVSPSGPLNRFSWPYLATLPGILIQAPHAAFLEALLGPLISPGKSIFLYNPILCLALPAWFIASPVRRQSLWAAWLTLGGLIILQALAYDTLWFGGVNYGPRFLLPCLPLLVVSTAPALERAAKSAAWRWGLGGLSVAGGLVQLGGVILNARTYYASFLTSGSAPGSYLAAWNPATSAILGHWRLLLLGATWNLAWARNWTSSSLMTGVSVSGWLMVMTVCLCTGWLLWLGRATRPLTAVAMGITTILLILLPAQMLRGYAADPLYGGGEPVFVQTSAYLESQVQAGDVVFLAHYGAPIWHYFMNQARLPVRWYSLSIQFSPIGQAGADEDLGVLMARLDTTVCRVWLINDLDEIPGGAERERGWLATRWPVLSDTIFVSAQARVKLSLFNLGKACP